MVSRACRRWRRWLARVALPAAFAAPLALGGCSAEFGGRCAADDECGEERLCIQGYCLPEDSPDRFADGGPDGAADTDGGPSGQGCAVSGATPAYDENLRPCADEHTAALWRFDDDFEARVPPGATPVAREGDPDGEQVRLDPAGLAGGAAVFAGADDPGLGTTEPVRATAPLTIELWARPAGQDTSSRALVSNLNTDRDDALAGGFELFIDQSDDDPAQYQLGLAYANGRFRQGYETAARFPAGRWVHLAGVIEEDGAVKLYVDGEEEVFDPIPATGRGRDLRIGRRAEGELRPYPGALDEIRLSTIARDAESLRRVARDAERPD